MKGDFRPAMGRRYGVRARRVGSGVQSGLVTLESSQSYSLACNENTQLSQLPGAQPTNRRSSRYASSGRVRISSAVISPIFRDLLLMLKEHVYRA